MTLQLCSGFGQYHSPENPVEPRPYATITLDGIEAMAAHPQEVDKAKAQWVIPSILLTRKHNEQRENGEFHALWADVDEPDGLTLEEIFSRAGSVIPGNFLAYTSRSATLERQKSRLYIPLEPPVNGSDYVRLQRILNNKLEAVGITPDRATERAGQICYLPNHGEFYDFQKQTTQGAFSADRWRAELEEEKAIEEATKTRMETDKWLAVTKARQRMESGCKSPIDAFNAEFPIPMMLESFGYLKKCDRWLSPNSSSRSPGVSLSDDGRKWISSHGSDSAIGKPTTNGTMGDAFDLFTYYQHNGSRDAAIKEAGEMFTTTDGLTITKANQRAYMATKEGQGIASVDAPSDNKEELFSLDQFVLNGDAEKMEAAMLDDVFVLGKMAILGQSTVFYAQPNAGKTLLTIWLLIEATKKGDIAGEDIFYINADDNHKGLTQKLKLAERHGFKTLATGYKGFEAKKLPAILSKLIVAGNARGKVLILDTVKKFTDIMRKDKTTDFGEAIRQFVSHGGTVIMLAHVNKHRGEDGKLIYSGTSDLVDDCDCAYTLDVITTDTLGCKRSVKFENFKSRGDVQLEIVYEYDPSPGLTYQQRVDSVRLATDQERHDMEKKKRLTEQHDRNSEAIDAIRDAIRSGVNKKTELIKAAMEASGLSKRKITKALQDHEGTNLIDYQYWTVNREDKNAHVYQLNWPE